MSSRCHNRAMPYLGSSRSPKPHIVAHGGRGGGWAVKMLMTPTYNLHLSLQTPGPLFGKHTSDHHLGKELSVL